MLSLGRGEDVLSAVVLDGWGAGSLTSNFQPKLTWVAHCMGNMRGALFIKHIGMTYMHKVLTIHMHIFYIDVRNY